MAKENNAAGKVSETLAADVTKFANLFIAISSAKTQHDHRVVGRQTSLSRKLRTLVGIAEFKLEEAATALIEDPDTGKTVAALEKAAKEINAKRDVELAAAAPKSNAPYHKPRNSDAKPGVAKGPAGPQTEQK